MVKIVSDLFKLTTDDAVGASDFIMAAQGGLPKKLSSTWLRSFIGNFSRYVPGLVPAPGTASGQILYDTGFGAPPAGAAVFGASGTGHAIGLVPDPGATARTDRVLFEDGIFRETAGFAPYRVGQYYLTNGNPVSSSLALGTGQILLSPYQVRDRMTLNKLYARVVTGVASSNIQLAIYASDLTGAPTGNPVLQTGSIPATSSGVIVNGSTTASYSFPAAGLYWVAVIADNASIVLQNMTVAGQGQFSVLFGANTTSAAFPAGVTSYPGGYAYTGQTFGTWPNMTGKVPGTDYSIVNGAYFPIIMFTPASVP